jgi:Cof subfamily protein (haloacid dehalogenase superfamily)
MRPSPSPLPCPIRLLAVDIDGTLVNSSDELTDVTRDALIRATEAGIKLVLATGRRYRRALPLVEPLRINAPVVTASGALIKRPLDHVTLYRADLDPILLRRLLSILDAAGYQAVLYADTFDQGYDFFCVRDQVEQPELADFLRLNAGCESVHPSLMTNPPPGIFAGFAIGPREEMLRVHDELQAQLPGLLYTHVLRSPRYIGYMCEIAPAGVTKWSGILRLANEWGIAADEICAVGDDVNDIPMITQAGLGVAMGNAVEEVKAAADWIAPTHDQDGLVTVVESLLQNRKSEVGYSYTPRHSDFRLPT